MIRKECCFGKSLWYRNYFDPYETA